MTSVTPDLLEMDCCNEMIPLPLPHAWAVALVPPGAAPAYSYTFPLETWRRDPTTPAVAGPLRATPHREEPHFLPELSICESGNFPWPKAANFPVPSWIKGVRSSRGVTEPAPQTLSTPALQLQAPQPKAKLNLMARAAAPAMPSTPSTPRLLRAALLLLLLVIACQCVTGAPVVGELRCQCLQTVQGIHLKNIQSVKVTPAGPHCDQTEVLATLKNGQEACLNPAAPMVKKIIEKMLKK
ncbi:Growth-regulated protein-alpha [Galemys pyrenaicus]|uniref:C-X-C motif chemokine n=1 Tax=Galemys pyrenaicus TaxID=202257 RepID=A0A8J6DNV5_GALPY|nr:Growth-regulated protein-alpha [Galemys pyrenaicus]